MYNIMLVDDELPAIRLMETIVSKYAPYFQVVQTARNGIEALDYLKDHINHVDLLITDISMPDMDGISLAKAVRELNSSLHIVIVSGYQDFEYARGAIEAAVDDYVLKPVSVSHMKELLAKIENRLNNKKMSIIPTELTRILNDASYQSGYITRFFGSYNYFFAILRKGNIVYPQIPLIQVGILSSLGTIFCFSGRDDKEFIFISEAQQSITDFQKQIRSFAKSVDGLTTTIVFAHTAKPISELGSFYINASKVLRHSAVIGNFTEVLYTFDDASNYVQKKDSENISVNLPSTILRQLENAIASNDRKAIHTTFQSIGKDWDRQKITQRQAYVMTQQLLHLVETVRRIEWQDMEHLSAEANMLSDTAESYLDLMEKLYHLLYTDEGFGSGQMTPEDMYRYAVRMIREKYDHPITIQSVCSEIGISQTYLSRLFRKFGDTSFNTQLVQCRIENAQRLMSNHPDLPLNQIAACCGYEDYAYFSKVFRGIVGMSPSQYLSQKDS